MSDRNFSRRRRGGMRFRPSSGLNPNPNRPDREALEARSEVVNNQAPQDKVYDRNRHSQEIERAENIALGLSPEEADRRARIKFGSARRVHEECQSACAAGGMRTPISGSCC